MINILPSFFKSLPRHNTGQAFLMDAAVIPGFPSLQQNRGRDKKSLPPHKTGMILLL